MILPDCQCFCCLLFGDQTGCYSCQVQPLSVLSKEAETQTGGNLHPFREQEACQGCAKHNGQHHRCSCISSPDQSHFKRDPPSETQSEASGSWSAAQVELSRGKTDEPAFSHPRCHQGQEAVLGRRISRIQLRDLEHLVTMKMQNR